MGWEESLLGPCIRSMATYYLEIVKSAGEIFLKRWTKHFTGGFTHLLSIAVKFSDIRTRVFARKLETQSRIREEKHDPASLCDRLTAVGSTSLQDICVKGQWQAALATT